MLLIFWCFSLHRCGEEGNAFVGGLVFFFRGKVREALICFYLFCCFVGIAFYPMLHILVCLSRIVAACGC